MELIHLIQPVTPVQPPHFVAHRDFPVCRMDYVETKSLFEWAPAQTHLGLGEAVSNTAVSQSSNEGICKD
jgi:hypothetical protein